ncbi:conjugal transfer protein, partial [Streptococcus pyogenes]
ELNSLLKNEEAEKLSLDFLDQIRSELRSYYYINGEINKLHKQLYAKGNKLIELASF